MKGERHDIQAAVQHACRHAQPPGVVPHAIRCDFVRGEGVDLQRCRFAANHPGDHKYEET